MLNKILFIHEKYYSSNPSNGLGTFEVFFDAPIRNCGCVRETVVMYCDEIGSKVNYLLDEYILDMAIGYHPDLIIFSPSGLPQMDPKRQTVGTLTKDVGIKTLMIRGDNTSDEAYRFNNTWFPFISGMVVLDATIAHLGYGDNHKVIQGLPTPTNKYFYNKNLKRDIDVSFIGPLSRSSERVGFIDFLKDNGINIVVKGGHGVERLEWNEYSDLLSRSKITLNFSNNTLKGRIFEALACKTMLIGDPSVEVNEFFDVDKDLVAAYDKMDMVNKIKYYLNHDDEREKIADTGFQKITTLYNAKNVWAYILNKMGFNILGNERFGEYYQKMESLR